MTIHHQDPTTFEDRLGAELSAYVSERPAPEATPAAATASLGRRARRPLTALTGVAAVAVAGILLSPGGSPAYAVEAHDDGSVTIEINDLTDASKLEQDLAAHGVTAKVDYLAPGKVCASGRFTPTQVKSPISQSFREDGTGSLKIRPADIPEGTTLVFTSAIGKNSTLSTIGFATGAVKTCDPVDAKTPKLPPLPAGAPQSGAAKEGEPHTIGGATVKIAPDGTKPDDTSTVVQGTASGSETSTEPGH